MKTITGSIVALVTPMHDDGSIDFDAVRRLIDWHVAEGTRCIGVVGTTGESPTVTVDEHCEIIRVAVEHTRGRIPVMAGTGGNSTAEAIELSRYALKVGADCTLSVVPYYNKPSQEGIYRHFVAVAEAVDIPMVVYNVPSRTVADMQTETALRLAQVPGIVGIKDATGDIARGSTILRGARCRRCARRRSPATRATRHASSCSCSGCTRRSSSSRAPRRRNGRLHSSAAAARPCACRSRR